MYTVETQSQGNGFMKLQIAFDITDLDKALAVAEKIEPHVDIFEIGTLLLYKHGESAVKKFREKFPQKQLLADAKIIDRSKDATPIFAHAGADWITIMAGADKNVIHTGCTVARSLGKKIMLDLSDASSPGQAALEAKSLGVDALIFHKPSVEDEHVSFLDRWEMVKGNTNLPIFISAHITRENIADVLSIGASGIIIGGAVVNAADPLQELAYFTDILGRN